MGSEKVAVVTGAGRRLGYCICRALIDRDYHVIALHRTRTDDLETLEALGAQTLSVDLGSAENVLNCIDRVLAQTERVDLLVNNASEFSPDPDTDRELSVLSTRLFQINTGSPMLLMSGFEQALKAAASTQNRPALVVNITDIFAERPDPRFAAYCASKAALANLSLSYAAKFAPDVRVNAIMPGPIQFLPSHTESQRQRVLSETLTGTEGGFDSVVIQLLALIDNDFMTGAQIPVDGGRRLAQGTTFKAHRNPK